MKRNTRPLRSHFFFHDDNAKAHSTVGNKWTLGEKSKLYFCKIQLVLDILQSMDYLMALKILLQSSSGVENELIKNN